MTAVSVSMQCLQAVPDEYALNPYMADQQHTQDCSFMCGCWPSSWRSLCKIGESTRQLILASPGNCLTRLNPDLLHLVSRRHALSLARGWPAWGLLQSKQCGSCEVMDHKLRVKLARSASAYA